MFTQNESNKFMIFLQSTDIETIRKFYRHMHSPKTAAVSYIWHIILSMIMTTGLKIDIYFKITETYPLTENNFDRSHRLADLNLKLKQFYSLKLFLKY